MDKASVSGTEDCRFESCHGRMVTRYVSPFDETFARINRIMYWKIVNAQVWMQVKSEANLSLSNVLQYRTCKRAGNLNEKMRVARFSGPISSPLGTATTCLYGILPSPQNTRRRYLDPLPHLGLLSVQLTSFQGMLKSIYEAFEG